MRPHQRCLSDRDGAAEAGAGETEVVFSRYGNQYLLKNIWVGGSNIGYVAENTLGERRLAKRGRHGDGAPRHPRKTAKRPLQ